MGVGKMYGFQLKTGRISETVRDIAKVPIAH